MRRSRVPLLVLLVGLGTTVVATWFAANYFEEKTRAEFTDAVSEASEDVRARIDAYVALLRGCSGLFAVQRQVTVGEFRAFVARLRVSSTPIAPAAAPTPAPIAAPRPQSAAAPTAAPTTVVVATVPN